MSLECRDSFVLVLFQSHPHQFQTPLLANFALHHRLWDSISFLQKRTLADWSWLGTLVTLSHVFSLMHASTYLNSMIVCSGFLPEGSYSLATLPCKANETLKANLHKVGRREAWTFWNTPSEMETLQLLGGLFLWYVNKASQHSDKLIPTL